MNGVEKADSAQADAKRGQPEQEVTISVNNRSVKLPDKHATGAEIKAAAEVPSNFHLYDEKGHEIADDKRVSLKDGDRFTAISGQDVS